MRPLQPHENPSFLGQGVLAGAFGQQHLVGGPEVAVLSLAVELEDDPP